MSYTDGRATLIGPFHLRAVEDGMIDAFETNGVEFTTVPAGSFFTAICIPTVLVDIECSMSISVDTDGVGVGPNLVGYRLYNGDYTGLTPTIDVGSGAGSLAAVSGNVPRWCLAEEDLVVRACVFSEDEENPPTAGEFDFYIVLGATR